MRQLLLPGLLPLLIVTAAPLRGDELRGDELRGDEPVDFASQIQPLLSDRCALCHGPDAESREAELRVDTPDVLEHATQNGGLDAVIVPGNAKESELVRRITSDDPYEQMPPPDSGLALSPEEIARIVRWIDQGAEWEQHWSLRPIERPEVPPAASDSAAASDAAPAGPIDRFVNARLGQQQLRPTGEADRYALIRRVTMDLTGLPPTPREIEQFVEDRRPDAYQRLVERLLASPAFGERMAAPWLDAARYADTYGYQADVYREVWPWRDWVIEALSAGMPYDQFLTWQIAGDLIPEANRQSTLATTFNRLHRQTNEGGSVEEEFLTEYVADRVSTLGTVVLGLTLECARCHDHKYDPISQRDFYQLFAFFNNIDEAGLYSHFTDAVPTPVLDLPTADQQRELDQARQAVEEAERAYRTLLQRGGEPHSGDGGADAETDGDVAADLLTEGLVGEFHFGDADAEIDVANAREGAPGGALIGVPQPTAGPVGGGLLLDGENGFETAVGGDWDWWQPWTIALWLRPAATHSRAVVWHRSRAWTDAGSRGYELLIEEGRLSAALIHFWPGDAARVRTTEPLAVDRWSHVAVTSDGSGRAEGLRIFVDGRRAEVEVVRDGLKRTIRGGGADKFTIGSRFRDRGFKGGGVDELRMFDRALDAAEIALLSTPADPTAPAERAQQAEQAEQADEFLRRALFAATDPAIAEARERLRQSRRRLAEARDAIAAIMVMREMPEPRESFILKRGQYDQLGEPVSPAVPEALGEMQSSWPRNRLGLARWLTNPSHPLTARVAVNRLWQMFFDRGLVATPEDFGMQGEPPSHPELLDYLAATLIAEEWDVKRLVRQIVTSDVYRRSSTVDPERRAADPDNRLLARGPSSRWPAELLRDAALAAGGLLDRRIGGPSVHPYQPAGLWSEKNAGSRYVRDEGAGSHRRSVYTIWKRTSPPPSMMIFDAPSREVCVAGRATTETPLQSLVLLNDVQFVEAARGVAYQLLRQSEGYIDQDVQWLFLRLLGRPASDQEQAVVARLVSDQKQAFAADREATERYLAMGDFRVDAEARADADGEGAEWAAWSVAAQLLMNLDEWVSRQ